MSKRDRAFESRSFVIDYWPLGTISVLEFAHAVFEDAHALQDIYNIQFVKAPRLRLYPTDEYGQSVQIIHPAGGLVRHLNTHHLRPACKDYEL